MGRRRKWEGERGRERERDNYEEGEEMLRLIKQKDLKRSSSILVHIKRDTS